jgi:hypothetical protein
VQGRSNRRLHLAQQGSDARVQLANSRRNVSGRRGPTTIPSSPPSSSRSPARSDEIDRRSSAQRIRQKVPCPDRATSPQHSGRQAAAGRPWRDCRQGDHRRIRDPVMEPAAEERIVLPLSCAGQPFRLRRAGKSHDWQWVNHAVAKWPRPSEILRRPRPAVVGPWFALL